MTIPYHPENGKLWLKDVSNLDFDGFRCIEGNLSTTFLSELPRDTGFYDTKIDDTDPLRALRALRGKHRGEARAMNVLPEDCGWSLMDGPCPHVRDGDTELESLACLEGGWAKYGRPGAAGPPSILHGGDCSHLQAKLVNVRSIFSTTRGFAALKADGSVVSWGSDTAKAEALANASASASA